MYLGKQPIPRGSGTRIAAIQEKQIFFLFHLDDWGDTGSRTLVIPTFIRRDKDSQRMGERGRVHLGVSQEGVHNRVHTGRERKMIYFIGSHNSFLSSHPARKQPWGSKSWSCSHQASLSRCSWARCGYEGKRRRSSFYALSTPQMSWCLCYFISVNFHHWFTLRFQGWSSIHGVWTSRDNLRTQWTLAYLLREQGPWSQGTSMPLG